MKLFLLANPKAAGGRARTLLPALRAFFARRVTDFGYSEAIATEDIRRQAQEAARAGYERVLVAGGDGTAHTALNALCGSAAALGILPVGYGNDLARALGVPLEPQAAAEFLLEAPVGFMDVARVGEKIFGCVSGVGFDSETNRRANSWGPWPKGHLRYFLAGLLTLIRFRPLRLEMVTDSEEFTGEVMWVAIANAPTYGGGVRIAPEARLDDGLLDVCIIERTSRLALLALYPSIMRGGHLRARPVRYFRCCRVTLRAPAGAALYGDGEFLGFLPLEIKIEPAAARVVRRPQ